MESFESKREKPFDPERDVLNAVSNIICTISFGYRFEYSDPKFARLIKFVKSNLSTASFKRLGLFQYIFSRSETVERRKRMQSIKNFIQGIIQVSGRSDMIC